MTEPSNSLAAPILRRIESIALFDLSQDERDALAALPLQEVLFTARQDIVREHAKPDRCFAVLSGIAASYKTTYAGVRQVLTYYVAGDLPDLQSLHLEVLDTSISAASACRVGFVRHSNLRAVMQAHPRLGDVFWRAGLIDSAMVRAWLLNNGRREANARMAHLLCELLVRLEAVGLAQDHTCAMPLTQVELADALGVTSVHVSRVLRDLRAAGTITLRGGRLEVHDWATLTELAEFDPTYLHLPPRMAGANRLGAPAVPIRSGAR